MKKKVIACFTAFIVASSWGVFAQESGYIKHRVNRGETVSKIAREYGLSVTELIEHNPEAKNGIRENEFVLIPNKEPQPIVKDSKKVMETPPIKTHVVEVKETIYSLTRKFKISVQDIYKWNPGLKENGLKVGETIYISEDPSITALQDKFKEKNESSKEFNKLDYIYKIVEPKETLYGIANEYNTTVQNLIILNPELGKRELKIGEKIKVPSVFKKGIGKMEEDQIKDILKGGTTKIKVEPKETIYSITKDYGISAEELLKLNPDLRFGLKTGMELNVPKTGIESYDAKKNLNYETVFSNKHSAVISNLEKSIVKTNSKEIAFLLPFNVDNLGSDIERKLKTDSFLNMTLDFYAGSLLAIEEANKLGLPLNVKVYDSNESKNNSSVASIVSKEEFQDVDVVIGPFFQNNINLLTQKLKNTDIVMVSPLSNEKAITESSNVIQTMPHSDVLKSTLLDYFISQKSNITVIVDDKKSSTKNFLQKEYPNVRVLNSSAAKTIGNYLVANTKNVFILDSNSIETALETTNQLLNKKDLFDIQLAAFEKNDVFDYSEITIEKLVALKLTYPSVTRENETEAGSLFAKNYKTKNNIYPSRYATRGYDVTMDVILRMFQKDGFLASMNSNSQQIENKFIYVTNSNGVIRNTGVYLLQYGEDLTINVIQ